MVLINSKNMRCIIELSSATKPPTGINVLHIELNEDSDGHLLN